MLLRNNKQGFTLIELLVVIAIIAILAAILFPVFANAKESSKRSSCLANLRQLGTAARLYADDQNGFYPKTRLGHWPFGDWDDGHPEPTYKFALGLRNLIPYVKNKAVFFCPSNVYFSKKNYNAFWGGPPRRWFAGYAYWGNYLKPDTVDEKGNIKPLTERDVAVNSGRYPYTLLVTDIIVTNCEPTWNSHNAGEPLGGNILYNDGHAKWKHFSEMKYLCGIAAPGGQPVGFYK